METPVASPSGTPRHAAIAALLANVDRLLNDGDTLIAAGGYASAASLAILAFEECGRAYALRFDLAPSHDAIDLRTYHIAVAMLGLGFATVRKYELDERAFTAAILPSAWDDARRDAAGSVGERLRAIVETTLEPLMLKLGSERGEQLRSDVKGLVEIAKLVRAGEAGIVRDRGFWVELDAQHRVASAPGPASRRTAERWAWAADGVYHLLKRDDHRHPQSPELAILVEALGQDRPTRLLAA